MISKKSQTAIEFIILIGFILFFFTTFFIVIQEDISEKSKERKTMAVKEIAMKVQDEINFAYQSINGYNREFNLPTNINGLEYSAEITDDLIYIKTQDNKHAIALPIKNITGQILKGENTIKKENGEVKLNE